MIRRSVTSNLVKSSSSSSSRPVIVAVTSSAVVVSPHRNYMSPFDPWVSLWCCTWVVCAGAAWGNNLHSLNKHGLFRMNMQIDNANPVEGSRTWAAVGGFIGFLFYWNIIGPMKYKHSDMEKWAKRIGPF